MAAKWLLEFPPEKSGKLPKKKVYAIQLNKHIISTSYVQGRELGT